MNAYYNEFEPYAADWIGNLAAAGHITAGAIDRRDIREVAAGDLAGFTRCHFFAGIAGWDYALQLAGWPADRPVWTASLPCQPFSAAGNRKGGEDDRHLWPVFYGLIRERKPPTIFGEQVEAAIGHGWLDRVFADLEAEGYACGAVSLPACSVGAPHIRQRLFWVAVSESLHQSGSEESRFDSGEIRQAGAPDSTQAGRSRGIGRLADARRLSGAGRGVAGNVDGPAGEAEGREEERQRLWTAADDGRANGRMGNANDQRPQGYWRPVGIDGSQGWQATERHATAATVWLGDPEGERRREAGRDCGRSEKRTAWSGYDLIPCADGKARRIESGTFPLVDGSAFRVGSGSPFEGKSRAGMLKAYGNCIVPQVAAGFIAAFLDGEGELT